MADDKLTLEYTHQRHSVTLAVGSRQATLRLHHDFSIEDVRDALDALKATGLITQEGPFYRSAFAPDKLRAMLEEILGYFQASGVPGQDLLAVKTAVDEYECIQNVSNEISWYAYACLDVMVRDDLADEARTTRNIWTARQAILDCQEICDRRVEQLAARHSVVRSLQGRMAASVSSRPSSSKDSQASDAG